MPSKPKSNVTKGKKSGGRSAQQREAILIGKSLVNRSDLVGLQRAWQHRQLVLFLGAGVSLSYGIPGWNNLVLDLLFDQAAQTRRLGTLMPHYRRAVTSWLADYFEYNPVVLARLVEDQLNDRNARLARRKKGAPEGAFLESIRSKLYLDLRKPQVPSSLEAVAKLIQKAPDRIPAVVTLNFDDLLERELTRLKVPHESVSCAQRTNHGPLPIIHPHGFIPQTGDLSKQRVVFTERDYHQLTESMFHWALTEIVWHLRHHTVLFVGLSMSDPNLRRLLDVCRLNDIPHHWQLQRRHTVSHESELAVIGDIENRARRWGKTIGNPVVKPVGDLPEILRQTLRQADTYDRELFERMGVKTIWLEDFADITPILESIGQDSKPC